MSVKPFLAKAWNEPRRFSFWLGLFSLLGLGIAVFVEMQLPDFSLPRWMQIIALVCLVGCALGLVIGFFGFVLSWIPAVYRFEIRLLRRRFFALACLITFVALLNAEENWRGKRAWENYKREWEAKGERFDLASFIPPTVPDEKNFAMTSLFKPIYNYTRGPNVMVWNDTNGLERLSKIRADIDPPGKSKPLGVGSLERGTFADIEAGAKFYQGNTNYPQPEKSGTAAENILFALSKFDVEMKELTDAAATRPYSRFPIQYNFEPAGEILLQHLGHLKGLCFLFHMRAVAKLEAAQAESALQDLKVGFRLSDSTRDEPFLIDHLVRLATCHINLQTLREGLVRRSWTDYQLADIEKYLGSLDLFSELKQTMRGERAFNLQGIDYIRRQGPADAMKYMDNEGGTQPKDVSIGFMPSGWLYQNMLTIARMHQHYTIGAVDEKQHRVFPEVTQAGSQATEALKKKFQPHNIFARMLFPALGKTGQRSGRVQTYVDAAYIACALERYRLVSGKFPEKLDELFPKFIEKIPTDVIDGQPLRYRLNTDGGYVLYSVGWNKIDDGGKIAWTKGKTPTVDASQGDWVWRYPAK